MLINELFYSIQGEGKLAGVPSVFVRTAGCNLRCIWCDSERTSWKPAGEPIAVSQIVERVLSHPTRFVVITGGEPLIQGEVAELTQILHEHGKHLTIETAGTVDPPQDTTADLMSISPKLAGSTPRDDDPRGAGWRERHEERRLNREVLARLIRHFDVQLKFVVQQPADLVEIREVLAQLPSIPAENVLLMPEGTHPDDLSARGRWITALCKEAGYRFCPRMHIELYGHVAGR